VSDTPTVPSLPDRAEVDATVKVIDDHADRIFSWNYERERPQLVTLYNKGMSSQWNSVTELDWSTDVDLDRLVHQSKQPNLSVLVAREAAQVPGSPFASWGDKEFTALGIETYKAQLSQFMHGEQGAMMAAAKIVETVPWIDAKYYAATQTMDEARHTEVFAKYIHTKLGEAYPMNDDLEQQVTDLLEDSRWDFTYLGMQIVIESLALAVFGSMLRNVEEPLLKNTLRSRYRSLNPEMWERLGIDFHAALPSLQEGASRLDMSVYNGFNQGFFAKLVPNVRKLGLLDANDGYLRRLWGEKGLLEYEFADDTGDDYTTYDEVARDRASASASSSAGAA
jgi:hypothetical protein